MSKRYKAKRQCRYWRRRDPKGHICALCPMESEPDVCWCGIKNPYFAPIRGGCGGLRVVTCYCGGDLCVCHNHGESECFGCVDCDPGPYLDEDDPHDELNTDDQL